LAALLKTLEIEPDCLDYLHAVADHYIKRGKFEAAKHPDNPLGRQMLRFMEEAKEKAVISGLKGNMDYKFSDSGV
jgi:hypothetical protein